MIDDWKKLWSLPLLGGHGRQQHVLEHMVDNNHFFKKYLFFISFIFFFASDHIRVTENLNFPNNSIKNNISMHTYEG